MAPIDHRRAALWLALAFVVALAVFVARPDLDLAVSRAFHVPGQGFPLAGDPVLQGLRELIWNLSIGVVLASLVALLLAAIRRPLPWLETRTAGFVFLLYLLGPGLLVNGLLKRYWGRARPADVAEFGGAAAFTPPWLPADQCASNCSFVSGEGSAAVALAVTFLVLAPLAKRHLPGWFLTLYFPCAVILPALGLGLRVATGRHFLSDTIFAALFVLAIALVLHRLLADTRKR